MPHLLQPSKFVITNLKYLFVVMDQKPQHIYTVTLLINKIKLHVILYNFYIAPIKTILPGVNLRKLLHM